MLLQRSRQAHRLYSSMERSQKGEAAEYTEMQAAAWRLVNAELVKQLTSLLDGPHTRQLPMQVAHLRDRFLAEFREAETALNQRHREVVVAAERGDFIRTALVSRTLVATKARSQAASAACSELEEALKGIAGVPGVPLVRPEGVGANSVSANPASASPIMRSDRTAKLEGGGRSLLGDLRDQQSVRSVTLESSGDTPMIERHSFGGNSFEAFGGNPFEVASRMRSTSVQLSKGISGANPSSEAKLSQQITGAELVRRAQNRIPGNEVAHGTVSNGAVSNGTVPHRSLRSLSSEQRSLTTGSALPREAKVIPLRRRSS